MSLWDIKPQVVLLTTAFIIGLVTGFLFDIYRRLRNLFSPGPFMTALGDLCFWGIITVITFASYLKISLGQVRGYVFLVSQLDCYYIFTLLVIMLLYFSYY